MEQKTQEILESHFTPQESEHVEMSTESSTKSQTESPVREREKKFQMFNHRDITETFGFIGLVMPAVVVAPGINTVDPSLNNFSGLNVQEFSLKLAAAHIEDAWSGRGKYGKARSYLSPKIPKRCFNILSNKWYKRMILLVIALHAILILFESPTYHISSVHPSIFVLNLVCLLVYVFDVVIHILFLSWSIFWSTETEETYWNGVRFILVCMFWLDYFLLILGSTLNLVFLKIFTEIAKVALSILIFVVLFACIGIHLLMETYNTLYSSNNANSTKSCCIDTSSDGETVYIGTFNHIGDAMLRLLVLLSTENYPEIMAPAYRSNRGNFAYFGIFIFVGVFFMTALFLAIIVDSYWKVAKIQVKMFRLRERAELAKAWNILDPCGIGTIDCLDEKLIKLFALLKPKNTTEQNLILISLLDSNQDGLIDSYEWTIGMIQILESEFEDMLNVEQDSNGVKPNFQKQAKELVENETFCKAVLILIILHVFLFTLKWRNQSKELFYVITGFRTFIVTLFSIEIIVKIIGLQKQFLRKLEVTDFLLVLAAVVFNILTLVYLQDQERCDLFIVLSSLFVFLRLFLNSALTRKAVRWFLSIIPVMIDLLVLLLISMYVESVIGMELFQGYHPSQSEFYSKNCGIGFDTILCSLFMLFQMLTTSNWHEIMNTVYESTKSGWTPLYFVSVYVYTTMILMNIFVAIAIEAANKLGEDVGDEDEGDENNVNDVNEHTEKKDRKKTIVKKAAEVLHRFAKNVFTSARTEDIEQRTVNVSSVQKSVTGMKRRRRATTLLLKNNPSVRRTSTMTYSPQKISITSTTSLPRRTKSPLPSSPDTDAEKPSAHKTFEIPVRTRRNISQHLKKAHSKGFSIISRNASDKKTNDKKSTKQCRVIVPGTVEEMSFEFGEILNVLNEVDDWVLVEQDGKCGWISISRILMLAREKKESKKYPDLVLPKFKKSRPVGNVTKGGIASSKGNLPNYKIKKTKAAGNWTRNILGDMGVMDADEMRELNKVMRAKMKPPTQKETETQKDGKPETDKNGPLARWRTFVNREILESTDDEDEGNSPGKPLWMALAEKTINSFRSESPRKETPLKRESSNSPPLIFVDEAKLDPVIEFREDEENKTIPQDNRETVRKNVDSPSGTPHSIEEVSEGDSNL